MMDSFWKVSSEAYSVQQANGRLSVRKAIENETESIAEAFCKSMLRMSWYCMKLWSSPSSKIIGGLENNQKKLVDFRRQREPELGKGKK